MTLDNPGAIWPALGMLFIVAAAIDAALPDKPGRWAGTASADDVARIVGGGKPKATPRTGAKLGALLVIVFTLFALTLGGK